MHIFHNLKSIFSARIFFLHHQGIFPENHNLAPVFLYVRSLSLSIKSQREGEKLLINFPRFFQFPVKRKGKKRDRERYSVEESKIEKEEKKYWRVIEFYLVEMEIQC